MEETRPKLILVSTTPETETNHGQDVRRLPGAVVNETRAQQLLFRLGRHRDTAEEPPVVTRRRGFVRTVAAMVAISGAAIVVGHHMESVDAQLYQDVRTEIKSENTCINQQTAHGVALNAAITACRLRQAEVQPTPSTP